MGYLKYYADEDAKFPAAHHTRLTREQMVAATQHLYQFFGLPGIPVYFSDQPAPGKRRGRGYRSHFRYRKPRADHLQGSRYICYGVHCWSALMVAHEVAHYVQHEAYRRDDLIPWSRDPGRPYPRRGRAHDHRHAADVARAVKELEAAGFVRPDGVEAIKAAKERYLKRVDTGLPGLTLTGTLEPA